MNQRAPKFHRAFRWIKPLLKLKTWREPTSISVFLAGVLVTAVIGACWGLSQKWFELRLAKRLESVGCSVEYGKISALAAADLDMFIRSNGCKAFERNLDDNVFTNYFVIPLTFGNATRNPVGKVQFEVNVGTSYAKILDVQSAVRKPKAKNVAFSHTLPKLRWKWPTNELTASTSGDYSPGCTLNLYCSIARDRGFGKVNPVPIIGSTAQLRIRPTSNLGHYYLTCIFHKSPKFSRPTRVCG